MTLSTFQQTEQQDEQSAKSAGFTGVGLEDILAIMMAESGGNPNAFNINSGGSIDRGILQINGTYHSEVSDSCAYDPACAFKAAYKIADNGTNFTPWTTYTGINGSTPPYLQFLDPSLIGGSSSSSSSPTNTIATSLQSSLLGIDLQSFGISSLFVIGGVIVVIMALVLIFKIKPPSFVV